MKNNKVKHKFQYSILENRNNKDIKIFYIFSELVKDAEYIYCYEELFYLIKSAFEGKKIILKLGLDANKNTIHIGHLIPLIVVKKFLYYIPNAVFYFIIATFTACVGEFNRSNNETVSLQKAKMNAEIITSYVKCFFRKYLNRVFFVDNESWLSKLSLSSFLIFAKRFKVNDILKKLQEKTQSGIKISSLLYPILQGYDSVFLNSDIEFGGSDQLLNVLFAREMKKLCKQNNQVCFLTSLLFDVYGLKMSKSRKTGQIFLNENLSSIRRKIFSIENKRFLNVYRLLSSERVDKLSNIFFYKKGIETLKLKLFNEICFYFNFNAKEYSNAKFVRFYKNKTLDLIELFHFLFPLLSRKNIKRIIRKNALKIGLERKTYSNFFFNFNTNEIFFLGKMFIVNLFLLFE